MGDYVGHLTALTICQLIAGIAQMAVWPFCANFPSLMAFSAVYGFFSGGIVSLPPVGELDTIGSGIRHSTDAFNYQALAEIYGTQQLASITGLILTGNIVSTVHLILLHSFILLVAWNHRGAVYCWGNHRLEYVF